MDGEQRRLMQPKRLYLLAMLIGLSGVILLGGRTLWAHAQEQRSVHVQVRWLISHQPTEVFAEAIHTFSKELSEKTQGRLSLEVVLPKDVGVTKGDIPNDIVLNQLSTGAVQLATVYTVALGKDDQALWSLNLPFAFDSYEQVERFLDGAGAQELLRGIGTQTHVEGLAFTMSGGFRIIASKNTAIQKPSDMRGLRVATSGGPVAEATLKALGATPVSLDLESAKADVSAANVDAVETTYSRLSEVLGSETTYTKFINETNHSVFLTAIVASPAFMESLSPEDQSALRSAALDAARVERGESIALGARTRDALAASGSTITVPESSQRAFFRTITQSVYTQFEPLFGKNLETLFLSGRQ